MSQTNFQTHSEQLRKQFFDYFQEEVEHIQQLPLSGSDRIYFKLSSKNHTAIGAYNPDLKENRTFYYFSELFHRGDLPVPGIYIKGQNGYYLQEYLPGNSLLETLQREGYTDEVKALYKKCLDFLIKFQTKFNESIDYSMCHYTKEFDDNQILSDLLYFKFYFLDYLKIKYNKVTLMEELVEMSKEMSAIEPKTFMYRDFQSRNILHHDDNLYFIDYQGGMNGIPQYDVVSLLWQAKASLPDKWKKELFNYYLEKFTENIHLKNLNEIEVRRGYLNCVLLRIIQTLGAYGFRGLIEKKLHFIQSIYPALNQLSEFLQEHVTYPKYPELRKTLEAIVKEDVINRFKPHFTPSDEKKLIVDIYSFSYKKGVAYDMSGNGGGFVFDCRGILNPGRIEAYKTQTGMDKSVQDYLEKETNMPQFLENAKKLVSITIDDYIARKFDHLSISFGCTGGQHRSVYGAEKMYEFLQKKYPTIQINKIHLEQEKNHLYRVIS